MGSGARRGSVTCTAVLLWAVTHNRSTGPGVKGRCCQTRLRYPTSDTSRRPASRPNSASAAASSLQNHCRSQLRALLLAQVRGGGVRARKHQVVGARFLAFGGVEAVCVAIALRAAARRVRERIEDFSVALGGVKQSERVAELVGERAAQLDGLVRQHVR